MSKTISVKELKKRCRLDGSTATVNHLTEALQTGDLKPEDFSLRDIAEAMLPEGAETLQSEMLTEEAAIGSVNVMGAVIETKIKEAYGHEVFAASKLVQTIPTKTDTDRIYQFGAVSDEDIAVQPGSEYPPQSLGADYVETPQTAKRGLIIPVTKEAVLFDRTHQILQRAADVGEALAANKEKRILEMILGLTNTYKVNGQNRNTYYSGTANDPWKNLLTGNELVNYDDIQAAEDLFGKMTDPVTGQSVFIEPDTVLVMPPKRITAHRLFYAASIDYSDETTGTVTTLKSPFGNYNVVSSRLAYQLLQAANPAVTNPDKIWLVGNFKRAFAYMENWGITVSRYGCCSEADFTHDIVVRFKASERGTPAVLDPRYVVKCTA